MVPAVLSNSYRFVATTGTGFQNPLEKYLPVVITPSTNSFSNKYRPIADATPPSCDTSVNLLWSTNYSLSINLHYEYSDISIERLKKFD